MSIFWVGEPGEATIFYIVYFARTLAHSLFLSLFVVFALSVCVVLHCKMAFIWLGSYIVKAVASFMIMS